MEGRLLREQGMKSRREGATTGLSLKPVTHVGDWSLMPMGNSGIQWPTAFSHPKRKVGGGHYSSISSCQSWVRAAPDEGGKEWIPGELVACHRGSQSGPQRPKKSFQAEETSAESRTSEGQSGKSEKLRRGAGTACCAQIFKMADMHSQEAVLQKLQQLILIRKGKDRQLWMGSPVVELPHSSFHSQCTCAAENTIWPVLFFSFCGVAWIKGQWTQRIFLFTAQIVINIM